MRTTAPRPILIALRLSPDEHQQLTSLAKQFSDDNLSQTLRRMIRNTARVELGPAGEAARDGR